MRLTTSSKSTPIGNVEIHEVFRVIELDAGRSVGSSVSDAPDGGSSNSTRSHSTIPFSFESLRAIESQIAIVVPCMDEDRATLAGVLYGISNETLIVVVSNSTPTNFESECELLADFCKNTERLGLAVHQKDEGLARAFHAAGMSDTMMEPRQQQTDPLRIRNGKGEGMMIGVALSKLAGKQFIGFIDADNQVAGAVQEYCKVYAAGLHYALHCSNAIDPHAMVRIKWNSKPKVKDNQLVFEKSGRSSRVVNEWMNRLLCAIAEGENQDDIIQTGNAGEHAMNLDFAMELQFATGYAVEPFQLIDAWEQFGAHLGADNVERLHTAIATIADEEGTPTPTPTSSPEITPALSPVFTAHSRLSTPPTPPEPRKVQIVQVETCNPHFHDTSKGEGHIGRMQVQGLSTIYHSTLTPPELRDHLRVYMKQSFSSLVGPGGEPEKLRAYPPMKHMDMAAFAQVVKEKSQLLVVGNWDGKQMI